jgi:inner membrane protein
MADSISISQMAYSPRKRSHSILWKVLIIVGLILGLLIPLNMIGGIIADRQSGRDQVQAEIAQTWADQQTILGPVLAIPYKNTYELTNDKGQKQLRFIRQTAYLLPQQFQVNANIRPETRYRGIYQSVVYISDLFAQGHFNLKTIEELNIPKQNILWNEAYLVFGVPSMKGINKKPDLIWQGKSFELLPGVNGAPFVNSGLYSPIALSDKQTGLAFKMTLSLKGSQVFSIVPIGKLNTINMNSTWNSPTFVGSTLPGSRNIDSKGFKATWEIPYFARSYSQAFINTSDIQQRLSESAVGVQLLAPVDSYRQSDRAVKYGVLFLVLTFATYFLFEIISQYRLHPFQYLLVGCALSLFYLLLIAISEVSRFEWAYAVASVSTVTAITLYSKAILGKIRQHAQWLIGGLLSILYAYLYVLLQLQDHSLLFGAIGLFIVLSIIMYVTRNIDWYDEQVTA